MVASPEAQAQLVEPDGTANGVKGLTVRLAIRSAYTSLRLYFILELIVVGNVIGAMTRASIEFHAVDVVFLARFSRRHSVTGSEPQILMSIEVL